ncbi:protein maelstrom homolog [Gastrophryne carolinensis]
MPNKKASRNAYFFFALEMIPELRRRGLQVSGVRDAIPLCSGDWALLSPADKERYAEKAKKLKNRDPEPTGPFRASGSFLHGNGELFEESETEDVQFFDNDVGQALGDAVDITKVVANLLEEQQKAKMSRKHLEEFYRKTDGLEKKVIYIINIFSHGEMPSLCEQKFVPCEIGCVRYSLKDGILKSFHDFIHPGALPLGFRYHCEAGSASTHQIPVSGFELANKNYRYLHHSLCEFVSPVPGLWTTLYCRNNDLFRVKWCLQWLADKAGMDNHFELQDIESLIIKYFRDKLDEEPSKSAMHRMLDVVHWDYANNTRCQWHEENDMWCCALASCKKISYCMSKSLASVYGITLTADHLPSIKPENRQSSSGSKTFVLDAKRYQKKMDHGFQAESLDSEGATGGGTILLSGGQEVVCILVGT